jgi:hypothetical protein
MFYLEEYNRKKHLTRTLLSTEKVFFAQKKGIPFETPFFKPCLINIKPKQYNQKQQCNCYKK